MLTISVSSEKPLFSIVLSYKICCVNNLLNHYFYERTALPVQIQIYRLLILLPIFMITLT